MWHNALLGEAFWPKCNRGVKRHKVYTPAEDKRKTDKRKCFILLRFVGFLLPLICIKVPGTGIEPVRPSLAKGFSCYSCFHTSHL